MTRSIFAAASLCVVLFAPLSAGQRAGIRRGRGPVVGHATGADEKLVERRCLSARAAERRGHLRRQSRRQRRGRRGTAPPARRAEGHVDGCRRQAGAGRDREAREAGRRHLRQDRPALHHRGQRHGARRRAAGRRTSRSSKRAAPISPSTCSTKARASSRTTSGTAAWATAAARRDRRADIISLEYTLRAIKEAELPANDAAWEKAIKFLQRTQNNSETNDQGWAANDGGFVYYPGFTYHSDGGTKSYGSVDLRGPDQLLRGRT